MNIGVEHRRNELVEMIDSQGNVRVTELSRLYGLSGVTVRSDLENLESLWHWARPHGGAVAENS